MKKQIQKINVAPALKAGATLAALIKASPKVSKPSAKKPSRKGSKLSFGQRIDAYAQTPVHQGAAILDRSIQIPPIAVGELISRALVALGALSLGLLLQLTLLSQTHFAVAQSKAFEDFRYQLANGTAPVGQVDETGHLLADGTPVAIIEIKKLNLTQVVLEGTSSGVTMDGLGHKRDSVLPGQYGISVIYGRQSAFGGSFGKIETLKAGDTIRVTTGQGEATYTVTGQRKAGDKVTNDLAGSKGRLTLVTAAGIPFMPSQVLRVEASLVGEAKATPNRVIATGAIPASNQAMAIDESAWVPVIFLLQGLIVLLIALAWARRNWGRPQAWLAGIPALLWVGSMLIENLIRLLPNLI